MLEALIKLDLWVESLVGGLYSHFFYSFFYFISGFGSTTIILLFFCFSAYFLRKKDSWLAAKKFVAVFLLNELSLFFLKWFVNRPRPAGGLILGETDGSFPSGHAAASMFIYGFLAIYLYRNYKNLKFRNFLSGFLVLLILLIGFSRLYLDVHYLSDILGGYLLGGVWLYFLLHWKK